MTSDAKSPADLVRGHTPVLPPKWVRNVPRVDDSVLESFRDFPVPDISDAVGALYTMSPAIRPLYEPIGRLVGRALTVKAPAGDSLTIHGAITQCQPGDVLVIDWRGHLESCSGGSGMLMGPIRQGLAGIVIDGAWRDIPDLQALGFPIFGRGTSSVSRAKTQLGEINVPVSCGGVVVNAGDVIGQMPKELSSCRGPRPTRSSSTSGNVRTRQPPSALKIPRRCRMTRARPSLIISSGGQSPSTEVTRRGSHGRLSSPACSRLLAASQPSGKRASDIGGPKPGPGLRDIRAQRMPENRPSGARASEDRLSIRRSRALSSN